MAENSITMNEMFTLIEAFMKDMNSRMQRLEEIHHIQDNLDRSKEEKIMYFGKTTIEADELKEKVHRLRRPKQHLLQYLCFVKMKGLNEQQVLHAFPLSLSGIATEWYYTLEVEKIKTWKELINLFMKQFAYDTIVDVTFNNLETMQQNDNETFPEFQARWRGKVCVSPIMDFEQSYNNGMRIEDTIHSGKFEENEEIVFAPTKKVFRRSNNASNVRANINVAPKLRRHFNPLGAPISEIFDHMCKRGHLKSVDPTPYPNPLPKNWDTSLYYHFHQKTGHNTDEYMQLKHEIQDLIDQNVIIQSAREAKDAMISGCA
uniref:Retrotransposon gag domain-containing protein n=1 Tax=Fagus sylvatica TaxID=28930 RepID=A0A2N9F5N6_FAGSY